MIPLSLAAYAVIMLLCGYDHAAAIVALIAMLLAAAGNLAPRK